MVGCWCVVGSGGSVAGEGVAGHLEQGAGEALPPRGPLEFFVGAVGMRGAPLAVHDRFDAVEDDGAFVAVENEAETAATPPRGPGGTLPGFRGGDSPAFPPPGGHVQGPRR